MGLLGSVFSFIGGQKAKKASRRAQAAELEMLNRAMGEQQRQFDLTRADFAPARSLLAPSVQGLGDIAGINGVTSQQAAFDQVRGSPLYQSLYDTGEEALLQNAAATGGVRGGNTQRSLADFGSDTFLQALMSQQQSLQGLAGLGMGATESGAQYGQMGANNISDLLARQGQVKAGQIGFRGGVSAQQFNNIGSSFDQMAQAAQGPGGFAGFLRRVF